MKILFMTLFLISVNSFAGFVAGSKANQCDRTSYISPSLCSEKEGEECFKVPDDSGECGIFKLQDVMVDDLSNPIWGTRSLIESCEGEEDCKAKALAKECVDGRESYYNAEYSEVWCNKITGYNQISSGKELVIDQTLKAQKDQEKALKAQTEALIASGKKAREACDRVLDLIGGFNLLPGRTPGQTDTMTATFADALKALQEGRPGKARHAIEQIPVDGVLVTQPMKDLALAQLLDYEAVP